MDFSEARGPARDTRGPARPAPARPDADVSDRFAAHVGVHLGPTGEPPCPWGATATLTSPSAWTGHGDDGCDSGSETGGDAGDSSPVPTGAVLALVDATARQAAELALGDGNRRASLVPAALGVQYRMAPVGPLTANATVPCEGVLADRADDQGTLRFSVAVDVVDAGGHRVASATVQWLATVTPPARP